ncbi:MAG: hypothetical protein QM756_34750 [Polyangiaceae bacterium]
MKRACLALGVCFATSFSVLAQAQTRETSVCVDVVVQRPPDKPPKADAPAPPTVPAPPATPGEAESKTAASEAPGDSPPETPPSPATTPATPTPLTPPPGPRADLAAALENAALVDPEGSRDPRVQSGAHLPLGQTPELYLKRLLEHFVTHERGFVAVKTSCEQRIVVELYPLRLGWTVFARYSGTGREERVDQLLPTELSQFAERSVLALLRDVPIGQTVDRNNVLWADSLASTQSIHGRSRATLSLGSRLRGGMFETVDQSNDSVAPKLRVFAPMLLALGYRGQFESFGVEAAGELDIGTDQVAASRNPSGGHVDFGGSGGVSLHAMRYANPRGLSSLYYGGGATFALHWFSVIKPEAARGDDPRSTLWSGGLDVDLLLGYEFLRASALSFFLQSELNLPAYAVRNQNDAGRVNSWFPGAALKLGIIF